MLIQFADEKDFNTWLKGEQCCKELIEMLKDCPLKTKILQHVLMPLLPALLVQLADIRPKVIKHLSDAIQSMAIKLQTEFETFAPIVTALAAVTRESSLNLTTPAIRCLSVIISKCKSLAIWDMIIDSLKFEVDSQDIAMLNCIEMAIHHWATDLLQPVMPNLFTLLNKLLLHNNQLVRKNTRQCIFNVYKKYPEDCMNFFNTLDQSVQGVIQKEFPDFGAPKKESPGTPSHRSPSTSRMSTHAFGSVDARQRSPSRGRSPSAPRRVGGGIPAKAILNGGSNHALGGGVDLTDHQEPLRAPSPSRRGAI